jgi:hypothetical protein
MSSAKTGFKNASKGEGITTSRGRESSSQPAGRMFFSVILARCTCSLPVLDFETLGMLVSELLPVHHPRLACSLPSTAQAALLLQLQCTACAAIICTDVNLMFSAG